MAGERIYETWQNLVLEVHALADRRGDDRPGGLSSVIYLLAVDAELGERMNALREVYAVAIRKPEEFSAEQADEFDDEAADLMTAVRLLTT